MTSLGLGHEKGEEEKHSPSVGKAQNEKLKGGYVHTDFQEE